VTFSALFAGMTELEFNTALMGVTPSQLKPLQNPFTAHRLRLLLIMKPMSLWRYSALYSFRTEHILGFQMGNPAVDEKVQLLLIRPDNETYTIRFSSPNEAGNVFTGNVSQDEINALLASARIDE
jgi:hypothetical protein